jgi:thiol-disulfide isomerase/thioredoxin
MKPIFRHPVRISLPLFLLCLLIGQGWLYPSIASAEEDFFEALQASRLPERVEVSNFSLPLIGGQETKLSEFKGKVVFLNFWATWCPYCRKERPALQALYDTYKDKEFVVLSISIDRTSADIVKDYVEAHHITFPNLHDQTSKVALEYGVRGVPTTYFIDRDGKAVGGVIGPREWDSKEAYGLVEQLLSETH